MKVLPRPFYERNTQVVAFELIGHILTFERDGTVLEGKIVETEAYFGAHDPASHAYHGLTPRNRVMFGPAGRSYVYFTYGNHYCLNVVTEKENVPGAVLIRAVEPISGISVMKKRRKTTDPFALTSGPGKLTQAFGITCDQSDWDLATRPFYIAEAKIDEPLSIRAATRVGISQAKDLLLRFYLAGNSYVSKVSGVNEKAHCYAL